MRKVFLLLFCIGALNKIYGQVSNNEYKNGAINIALPKTPESQAFEKYGEIPVSEMSGTANISIPIYTLRSKFLEVPINVSYSASGIKVNQEASCVGLGFDLIAGGRITVETRGCIDNDGATPALFSPTVLKYGMQKLFTRLGNSGALSILTFASTCFDCDTSINHNVPDDWASVNAMAQYGLGEPDIFRANFMGQSLTFYFDKLTDSLKFLGEKSLFDIVLTKDAYQRILTWTITDNLGNKYYFNQRETTTLTLPPMGPLYDNTATSAWLLTKILHPTGDSIVFSYSNYGSSYPAYSWSSSMSFMELTRVLTTWI